MTRPTYRLDLTFEEWGLLIDALAALDWSVQQDSWPEAPAERKATVDQRRAAIADLIGKVQYEKKVTYEQAMHDAVLGKLVRVG